MPDSDTTRVLKEQALWKIANVLEQLVGEQLGILEEMVKILEFFERTEDILQDLVDQTRLLWMQWNYLHRCQELVFQPD